MLGGEGGAHVMLHVLVVGLLALRRAVPVPSLEPVIVEEAEESEEQAENDDDHGPPPTLVNKVELIQPS